MVSYFLQLQYKSSSLLPINKHQHKPVMSTDFNRLGGDFTAFFFAFDPLSLSEDSTNTLSFI